MERGVEIDDVILTTSVEGIDLLPSNIDLSAAEVQLVNEVGREQALGRALQARARPTTTSSSSTASRRSACSRSTRWPAPSASSSRWHCEFFALRGVALLMDTIDKVQDRLNPELQIIGILATMYDPRTLHAARCWQRVRRGIRRPRLRQR